MKYWPLLEIIFCVGLVYLVPEGIFQVARRRMKLDQSPLRSFIATNVKGFFFGSAVTLAFLFAFGVSYEDFAAGSIRRLADGTRRALGMDAVSICVRRTREQFRYDAGDFVETAASFNPLGKATYDPRDLLLSEGWTLLMLPRGLDAAETPEALYQQALVAFCSRH